MQPGRQKLKILIVDDVDSNRFVLRDIIAEMGYQPILAENGVQALKVVEKLWPQLVISDVAMPEMDGYEFCQIMKNDPKMREIPIIFISAYDNPEDVVKGFEIGGEDYITKPFIKEVVKARVGVRLKLYETNWELADSNRHLQASISEQLYQLELEKKNVLYALTRVARENAAYDSNHMERLIHNSEILAEAIQLSTEFSGQISDTFIETISLAAPLCDLGNVAIPTQILQKIGKLDEEEYAIMQEHTNVGAKIIKDVQSTGDYNDFLQMSYEIAKYHHEHWDGSGYPTGKEKNAIPLSAQIIAIMSDYCALTEKRVFREAYDSEQALLEMDKAAGKKYNPDIYKILKMIVRQLQ